MSREFKNRVREQFGRAADGYIHDKGFATGDDLEMMVQLLKPMPDDNMLDVACGGGHTALRFAPLVRSVVASDLTMVMLKKAQEFISEEGGVDNVTFREADAEDLPFPDESFDLAISEYGASIWADPYRWIPEAARVLRPGGELIFMVNGTILMLCMPDAEDEAAEPVLLRDYFGMHRFDWPDDGSVEFHLGYGDMIRLLRDNGLVVEDLIEVQPPEDATTRYPFVTLEWSRRWPCEEIWKARKI